MTKHTVINIIAQCMIFAVNICISFFLVPYMTKSLGVSAYGFVGLANDFVGYVQIITIALNSMASRFITIKIHEGNLKEANKYYSSVIIANIIMSIFLFVVGSIFIIFLDKIINIPTSLIGDTKFLFGLMLLNFIISIVTSTFSVATFCTDNLYLSSIKTIISQIIKVILLLAMFILLKPAVYYIGIATVISTSYLGYCNYKYSKSLTPELQISRKYFNIKYIKNLISSGIWNTISRISSILSNGLDLLIANIFIGSTGMGIISVAKTLPNNILSAFGAVSSVFAPELTIDYAKKDYEKMKQQLLNAIKFIGVFSAIPIVILFVFGKEFYTLWVPTQDANLIYWLSFVAVLGLCISLPMEPLWNIFTITNKVKNSSLFLLMNAVLTTIIVFILLHFFKGTLIRKFIIVGVSVAFSIIRSLTFLPLYGSKCLKYKWGTFYPTIMKNILIIIIATLCSLMLKNILIANSWLSLIFSAIVVAIVTFIISLVIVLTKDDKKNFKRIVMQKVRSLK